MFSVSLALLANAFRGKDRGIAFGVWGAITGLAVAVGPLVGGALVTGLSWRWIFFVNLPVGVARRRADRAAGAPSPGTPQARRPDWAGFVLFSAALACLVYGLIESGRAASATAGDRLLRRGRRAAGRVRRRSSARVAHPMFDLSLFRLPTFAGGDIAAFGVSAGIFSVLLYLVLYLQDMLGLQRAADRRAAADPLRRDPREQRRGRAAEPPGARCGC